jgi:general secretion pathway protein J
MREGKILKFHWQCHKIECGFTLIELLLAILIATIVLTVVYSSFFQIIKAKDVVETELDLYHEARVVLSKFSKDLHSAYPRGMVVKKSKAQPTSFFVGETHGERGSSIKFTSFSRKPGLNSNESDQAELTYYLQPMPESDLYYLMREENPLIGNETGGNKYPIAERLVDFRISYLTELDDEEGLAEKYDSKETGSLPKAVEVYLTIRSQREDKDITFNSLVFLPLGS